MDPSTNRGTRMRERLVPWLVSRYLDEWPSGTSISTWMGDRQGRLSAVNLCPFVTVDLNLRPTIYIAVILLTRT